MPEHKGWFLRWRALNVDQIAGDCEVFIVISLGCKSKESIHIDALHSRDGGAMAAIKYTFVS
jgi:hypothetical protein